MTRIKHDNGRTSQNLPGSAVDARAVTVAATSTEILPANANRGSAMIHVLSGGPVYLDTDAATTAGGFPVANGSVFQYTGGLALFGIVASATAAVRVWDETA